MNGYVSTGCNSNGITMNMVRVLAKQRSGLRICHINAQSLNNKTDEFRLTFENSEIDIICVSETWLKKEIPDSRICLEGYKTFRADRQTHAGGVAIFVKNNINCRTVCTTLTDFVHDGSNTTNKIIEYVFIEILSSGNKLLLGSIYRPCSRIDMKQFFTMLQTLTLTYSDVIICGDINSNLLKETVLVDSMIEIGLAPTNTEQPTHFSSTSSTLIDVFFVGNIQRVQLYDQISAPGFSKHDLIFLSYDFNIHNQVETYTYRDFKHINFDRLNTEFSSIDWNTQYSMASAELKLNFLVSNILKLYNSTVPEKTKRINSKTRQWFTSEIKVKIEERDLAYSRWKRFKTTLLRNEYCQARRDVNSLIRKTKSEYFTNKFSTAINSKQTWQTIKEIGVGKSSTVSNNLIDVNVIN